MDSPKKLIGNRIKELRRLRGLTQEQLAEMVEIDPRHLSGLETGRYFPSFVTLLKITEHLQVELPDIFQYSDHIYNVEELKIVIKNMIDNEPNILKLQVLVKIVKNICNSF